MKYSSENPQKLLSSNESLNTLMAVLLVLMVFTMASRVPVDADMWWHLRAGEETVRNGQVYLSDTMTFTRYGEAWVNHSWLGEVILFLAYQTGGFIGLALFVSLLASATMLILYRSMHGGVFLRAIIVILASATLAPIWAPRPQQFSLLLFALLNYWLMQYLNGNRIRLWNLPVLFVLWSNLHGGYSFGFLLLGVTLGGMILDQLFRPNMNPSLDWLRIGRLADWTAISLVAVLLNPNGLDTWKIPFQTIGVQFNQYIQEWQSLDFHSISSLPFVIMLFGCLVSIGLSNRRASGKALVGLTFFGAAALNAQRLLGIFALFAAPVFATHTSALVAMASDHFRAKSFWSKFNDWRNRSSNRAVGPVVRSIINLTLIAMVALGAVIKLIYVSQPAVVEPVVKSYYPVGAVDFLSKSQKTGNILNDYGWGGYLDWRLRGNKVFIDGRADFFPQELFDQWLLLIGGDAGWQAKVEQFDIRFILLPPEMPVIDKAVNIGWKVLYSDNISVLLERP